MWNDIITARNQSRLRINLAEMRPKTGEERQNRIFQMRLENMINMEHELLLLSEKINWKVSEKKFGEVYIQDVERPGLPTRLMVGLHYLKGME